jgi:hypothetical protein
LEREPLEAPVIRWIAFVDKRSSTRSCMALAFNSGFGTPLME